MILIWENEWKWKKKQKQNVQVEGKVYTFTWKHLFWFCLFRKRKSYSRYSCSYTHCTLTQKTRNKILCLYTQPCIMCSTSPMHFFLFQMKNFGFMIISLPDAIINSIKKRRTTKKKTTKNSCNGNLYFIHLTFRFLMVFSLGYMKFSGNQTLRKANCFFFGVFPCETLKQKHF